MSIVVIAESGGEEEDVGSVGDPIVARPLIGQMTTDGYWEAAA